MAITKETITAQIEVVGQFQTHSNCGINLKEVKYGIN
jgi:hypothetical protein